MRILLLFGLASWALSAQPVSIGVKGGIPITDALTTVQGTTPLSPSYIADNHRWLAGGTIQLNFPFRFSVEADGLYRRMGFNRTSSGTVTGVTANSWEFPVLGKYAILPGPVRPFVAAGANFRHVASVQQSGSSASVSEFVKDFTTGFTFGGGVEFKLGIMRITPELRYTHWGSENFSDPINSLLHTNENQGDFMLGVTF